MYVRPESQRKVYPVKECAATILCLATVLACAGEARADRRIFAYTYPYMTLPGGSFELEHYLDLGLKGTTTELDGSRIKHDVAYTDRDFTPDGLKEMTTPRGSAE